MYYEIETKNGNRLIKDQESGQVFFAFVNPESFTYLRPSTEDEWQNAIHNWGGDVMTVFCNTPFRFSLKEDTVLLVYKVANFGHSKKFDSAWAVKTDDGPEKMSLNEALNYVIHLQNEGKSRNRSACKLVEIMRGNEYEFLQMGAKLRIVGTVTKDGDLLAVMIGNGVGASVVHLSVCDYRNIDPAQSCCTEDFAMTVWPQLDDNGITPGSIMLWGNEPQTKAIHSQTGLVDMG